MGVGLFTRDGLYVSIYVCGSVFFRRVDNRPHRLLAGRGWQKCTAQAKCHVRLPCYYCFHF